MSEKTTYLGCAVLLSLGLLGCSSSGAASTSRATPEALSAAQPPESPAPAQVAHAVGSPDAPPHQPGSDSASAEKPPVPGAISGLTPANLAAQQASVVEAARGKHHPERLSPLVPPTPFDAAAYARDPAPYLNVVEPGRVWQVQPAGPGVPALAAESPASLVVGAHGGTTLVARSAAGDPVTFTSLDKGVFANGLTSITVPADAQGRARAYWQVDPGTTGGVRVLAGSPLASGTLTYRIDIDASISANAP